MKVLYNIDTRAVLAIYSADNQVNPYTREQEKIVVNDGQELIDVPDSITVPEAIVSVNTDGSFEVNDEFIKNQWASIRLCRDQYLKNSDWICSVSDYIDPKKEEWITYRKALRDITKQTNNPYRVVWPTPPNTPSRP